MGLPARNQMNAQEHSRALSRERRPAAGALSYSAVQTARNTTKTLFRSPALYYPLKCPTSWPSIWALRVDAQCWAE